MGNYGVVRVSAGASRVAEPDRGEWDVAIRDQTWFPETVPQWEPDEISELPSSIRRFEAYENRFVA